MIRSESSCDDAARNRADRRFVLLISSSKLSRCSCLIRTGSEGLTIEIARSASRLRLSCAAELRTSPVHLENERTSFQLDSLDRQLDERDSGGLHAHRHTVHSVHARLRRHGDLVMLNQLLAPNSRDGLTLADCDSRTICLSSLFITANCDSRIYRIDINLSHFALQDDTQDALLARVHRRHRHALQPRSRR